MKKTICILLLAAMLLTASCGKETPDDTLPKDTQNESVTDTQAPETESASEAATETEPVTEPATEAATETEPATETETEKATVTEPASEPADDTSAPETDGLRDESFPYHQDRIQIGIYIEPKKQHTDAAHYNQLQKAGITYIQMTNPEVYLSAETMEKMLTLCDERKIAVFVNSQRINTTVASLARKAAAGIVEEQKHHPSFAGIFVIDEPRATEEYAPAYKAVVEQGYYAHMNLFPYGVSGTNNYQGYVEDSIISMGAENMHYIQFDHYPFRVNKTASLFQNMNLYREVGLKYGLDTAFYVQSMGAKDEYREPNENEIRYHVSTGLAYGFKHMTYFTWMTPKDVGGVYTYAILDDNGRPTDMYDSVCKVNAKVHDVGAILGKLDALKVTLTTGKETGIEAADPANAALHPKGKDGFIVSYMEERGGTQEYVMVVNNSFENAVTDTFTVSKNVTALTDCTTGTEVPVDISSGEITLTLAAGDFMLFKLGGGDDFVQVRLDLDAKNLAENKPVAVEKTYTNAFDGSGSFVYCLTDGLKVSNRTQSRGWHCKTGAATIDIDLKRAVEINRVDVYPYDYSRLADYAKLFPRDFDVQVSADGVNWTTVATVTGFDETKDGIPSLKFDAVQARYVRINVTKGVGKEFQIAEIEVYNDDGSVPAVKEMYQ